MNGTRDNRKSWQNLGHVSPVTQGPWRREVNESEKLQKFIMLTWRSVSWHHIKSLRGTALLVVLCLHLSYNEDFKSRACDKGLGARFRCTAGRWAQERASRDAV